MPSNLHYMSLSHRWRLSEILGAMCRWFYPELSGKDANDLLMKIEWGPWCAVAGGTTESCLARTPMICWWRRENPDTFSSATAPRRRATLRSVSGKIAFSTARRCVSTIVREFIYCCCCLLYLLFLLIIHVNCKDTFISKTIQRLLTTPKTPFIHLTLRLPCMQE